MTTRLLLTIADAPAEDLYWQDMYNELCLTLTNAGLRASPILRPLQSSEGMKSVESTQLIQAIVIMVEVGLVPLLVTALKQFSSVCRAKKFHFKADDVELSFNAMDATEIETVLKIALLKKAVAHEPADGRQ